MKKQLDSVVRKLLEAVGWGGIVVIVMIVIIVIIIILVVKVMVRGVDRYLQDLHLESGVCALL